MNEKHRAERIVETMKDQKHHFPLIEKELSKEDVHGMSKQLGIQRPVMYDLGYTNNNCIGCVKGGMGYWNKIRKDFPDVFEKMANLEREIGRSCINGTFLDELKEEQGRNSKEIIEECSIFCQIALDDKAKEGLN